MTDTEMLDWLEIYGVGMYTTDGQHHLEWISSEYDECLTVGSDLRECIFQAAEEENSDAVPK